MRSWRISSTAIVAAVLAIMLAGCTVSIIDPSAPEPPENTTDAPSSAAEAPPSTTEPSAGFSSVNAAERDAYLAAADTTMTCPDARLDQTAAIVRIEGACAHLIIDIDAGVVIADDVEEITLNGDGTVVYVNDVSKLLVTGSANSVLWTGEAPDVKDIGTANSLGRG